MAMDDLYIVLQVDPQADVIVIRAACHLLARKDHPDAGGYLKRMVQIMRRGRCAGIPSAKPAPASSTLPEP